MAKASVGSPKRSGAEGMVPGTGAEELFTYPWPGPGNSDGPVDPCRWSFPPARESFACGRGTRLAASRWPGR